MTVESWCEGKGIKARTMAEMARRLRRDGLLDETGRWVEVLETAGVPDTPLAEQPLVQIEENCEIHVEIGAFRIAVPAEFSEAVFLQVCKALMSLC